MTVLAQILNGSTGLDTRETLNALLDDRDDILVKLANYLLKDGLTITPTTFGAVGDGVADDTAAVIQANTMTGRVVLPPNITYKVGTATVGVIVSMGGSLKNASGDVFTFKSANGNNPSQIIFKGDGAFVAQDRWYSYGWFDGASWDECHAFWHRCQVAVANADVSYNLVLPPLPVTDKRVLLQYNNTPCWKQTSGVNFDDPENQGIIHVHSFVKAANAMDYMISYSGIKKTEQIEIPLGWKLYGDNKAKVGILIHGGARIIHGGRTMLFNMTEAGVRQSNDLWPCDEIEFNFLDVTGFGLYGYDANNVSIAGNTGSGIVNPSVTTVIDKFFSNGGIAATAQAYIRVKGEHRGFTVRSFLENQATTNGLGDVNDAAVVIESAANGTPRAMRLGPMQFFGCTKSAIVARDTVGGSQPLKIFMSYDYIVRQTAPTGGRFHVDLSWIGRADCGPINEGGDANSIRVNSLPDNCANVAIKGIRRQRVTGNCDYMTFDGKTWIVIPTLTGTNNAQSPTGGVFSQKYNGSGGRTGPISFVTNNPAISLSGTLIGGTLQGYKGANIDVGTTDAGTVSNVSLVIAGDQITITNRTTADISTADFRAVA